MGRGQVQRADRLGGNQLAVGQRRQLHQPYAVFVGVSQLVRDGLRQPRLADTRGANDRYDAVLVEQRAHVREVCNPTVEWRQEFGQVVLARRRLRLARCRQWRGSRGSRRQLRDLLAQRRREAITAPWNGRDGLRPEQFAQAADLHLQVVLLDHQTGPDELQQFVLADRAVAVLDQRHQHVEGTRTQLGRLAPDQQLALGAADHAGIEAQFSGRGNRSHCSFLLDALYQRGRPFRHGFRTLKGRPKDLRGFQENSSEPNPPPQGDLPCTRPAGSSA